MVRKLVISVIFGFLVAIIGCKTTNHITETNISFGAKVYGIPVSLKVGN